MIQWILDTSRVITLRQDVHYKQNIYVSESEVELESKYALAQIIQDGNSFLELNTETLPWEE